MRIFQTLIAVCLFAVAVNARTVSVDKEGAKVEVIQDSPAKEEVVQDSPDKEEVAQDTPVSEDSEEVEAPVSEDSEEAADEEQGDKILNDEELGGDEEQEDEEDSNTEQDEAEVADDTSRDVSAEVEVLKEFPASLDEALDPWGHGYIGLHVPNIVGCSKSEDGGDWSSSFDHAGWSKCHSGNNFISGFRRSPQGAWWEDRIGRLEEAKCCRVSDLFLGTDCRNTDWSASFDQNNRWNSCPTNYYLHGLRKSNGDKLGNIEEAHCCKPTNSEYGKCYTQDISSSFDRKGWSTCKDGYLAVGLYRSSCDKLHCIEKIKCCHMALNYNRWG